MWTRRTGGGGMDLIKDAPQADADNTGGGGGVAN